MGDLVLPNRARRRRKMRERFYDGADDTTGKPFTKKGVRHRNGKRKFQPLFPPEISNHERVFRQRLKSGRYKRLNGDQTNG